MTPGINVQEVMQRVRQRVASDIDGSSLSTILPNPIDLSQLQRLVALAGERLTVVGRLPAQPPTLRARIGGLLVRIVRRALFWYTPPIEDVLNAVVQAVHEELRLTAELSRHAQLALEQGVRFERRVRLVERVSRELDPLLLERSQEAVRAIAQIKQEWVNVDFLRLELQQERQARERQDELLQKQWQVIEDLREVTRQLSQRAEMNGS